VHTGQRPRRDPGPLAFHGRTAAKYSNRVNRYGPWRRTAGRSRHAPALRSLRRRPPSSWRSVSAGGCAVPPSGAPSTPPGASCTCAGCSAAG